MNQIDRLITRFAGAPLCRVPPPLADQAASGGWRSLLRALSQRNGFYAFESALHVLPLGEECPPFDVIEWNRPGLWKSHYARHRLDEWTCFAENIFGEPFCFGDKGFGRMDAETGEIEILGASLDDWAGAILADPDYHLGHALAHAWQAKHGGIEPGMRLVPQQPFILGGGFEIDNLYPLESLQAMRFRGDVATQLHDVPDGSTVQFAWHEPQGASET